MSLTGATKESKEVMTEKKASIAVAHGDGIGPEIMSAVLHILKEAGARLDLHEVEIGEQVYLRGHRFGIEPETWDVLRESDAFLKAPITTPQGGGFKSINVTVRTLLGLYANVRPCVAYHPFVQTKHPHMDVVVVRENVEDLYVGIEYKQTPDCVEALKIITRHGCDKIIRYAFQYAETNNRKKVTCFTKDNILKQSDGLFHKVFQEIASEYPHIENEHWIIDIGAAKLADKPDTFDVVVMPNLYGDILSDVSAQIAGSVGLAGSANIGENGAMFEAIHGSAPRRANQNLANPTGLLMGAIMMLVHLGQGDVASRIHNGWLRTIEEGIATYDIFQEGISKEKVGTKEFGEAVVKRLGQKPQTLKEVVYNQGPKHMVPKSYEEKMKKELHKARDLVGIDVFIHWDQGVEDLQQKLSTAAGEQLSLALIANRGAKVWPDAAPNISFTDCFRCRYFSANEKAAITHQDIITLLSNLEKQQLDFVKTEQLYKFDGEPGYTVIQGELGS